MVWVQVLKRVGMIEELKEIGSHAGDSEKPIFFFEYKKEQDKEGYLSSIDILIQ